MDWRSGAATIIWLPVDVRPTRMSGIGAYWLRHAAVSAVARRDTRHEDIADAEGTQYIEE